MPQKIILEAKPPFSLHTVIHSHGWIQLAPFYLDPDEAGLSYIYRLQSGRVVKLLIVETDQGVSVDPGVSLSSVEQEEIVIKINWMLGLGMDFSKFYQITSNEPKLARAQERAQGRVLRSPTLFEDTIKTILTTNTVWGSTRKMVERLVAHFGAPFPGDTSLHAFPTPEAIAKDNAEVLRSEIRLGYRAPYIYQLSQKLAARELDLESLKQNPLSTPELLKELLSVKGVGNYAAANLLMLLGRYDYIPIDSWALKVVSHEWYHGEPIGPQEVASAFEKWGEWKGLAFWLWEWSINEN